MRKLFFGCLLALLTALALANEAKPVAANPALEKRVMAIAEELRCLVCQNETIAASTAPLAVDLKKQVREMLEQGLSDKDILGYMVQRYGDFVLYRPPVKVTTWLLWFGPFVLLIGGLVILGLKLSRRRTQPDALPESEMQRAAELLRASPDVKEKK